MKKYVYIILLILGVFPGIILAGGFQLNEHGAKPMGLGGAFTAIVNDASAVYWNGAALSYLEGTNLLIGAAIIGPSTSFRGVSPAIDKSTMISQTFIPPHFFASHKISDAFSVGLGASVPFGLGTKWREDWMGRYLAVETELQTISFPLVISWAILENLSISVGGSYSFAEVIIAQANSQTPFEGDAFIHLEGDDKSAFGYNAGILWKPTKDLSIGAAFKSEVDYGFEGTATATGAEQLAAVLPKGNISAELTTPLNIQGGIGYRVIEQLQLSADFQWVGWSSYDKLAVDFEDPAYDDISRPRNYEDTYAIRFGAEYFFDKQFSFLGGIYFDAMPVQPEYLSPSLPDADRLGFSLGIDAKIFENFGISGSYLFIRSSELTVTNSQEIYTPYDEGNEESASRFNGTYNSSASLFSFSLYYNF
ncbi:MAG TPA: outer membrane protein transport protein [Ignavibacteriaceae bacterium]|nr:outer membrane protein transport protein [Ignavibacteriaceae bacterium]